MGETFKTIFSCVLLGCLGALAVTSATYDAAQSNSSPTIAELQEFSNNSGSLLVKKQQKVIKKSRESVVQVISASPEQHVAMQSGTYVTFLGRHFVLTMVLLEVVCSLKFTSVITMSSQIAAVL